jgi:hypothetical protein
MGRPVKESMSKTRSSPMAEAGKRSCYRDRRWSLCVARRNFRRWQGIIGVRYDATEIMQGVTEMLCYGTAVIAKPA